MSASSPYWVFYDTETKRIRKGHPYPELVCSQFAKYGEEAFLLSYHEHYDQLGQTLVDLLEDPNAYFALVNAQFDMIVTSLAYPQIEPLIWGAYEAERILDLSTAQKCYALREWGEIDSSPLSEPGTSPGYGLNDLTKFYGGPDRSEQKLGAVRLDFQELIGIPVADWPKNAVAYALADVTDMRDYVLPGMQERGPLPPVAAFRAKKSFALGWITQRGVKVNAQKVREIDEYVKAERDIKNFPMLVEAGVVVPSEPSAIIYTTRRDHVEDCPKKGCDCPIISKTVVRAHVEGCKKKDCDCPPKWRASKKETKKTDKLAEVIREAALAAGDAPLLLTDGAAAEYEQTFGEKRKQLPASSPLFDSNPKWIACSKDVFTPLTVDSKILREYARRSAVEKLHTDYIHRFFWDEGNQLPLSKSQAAARKVAETEGFDKEAADVQVVDRMHFAFRDMVRSGRVGSFGESYFPSMNGQNPPPVIRPAMEADPGFIMVSTDYGSLELRAAASRCLALGIRSVLVELYSRGADPHGYLGAALARDMSEDSPESFDKSLRGWELYEHFMTFKGTHYDWWKLWRTFAKPVGLGAFGALGATTMALLAHGDPYNLDHITRDDCRKALEVWAREFPESVDYFNHVRRELRDFRHSRPADGQGGKPRDRYIVDTPRGLVRANCNWNEACNGFGLQMISAEGAGETLFRVQRAMRDWTQQSVLFGAQLLAFLHDELVAQFPIFEAYARTDAMRVEMERLMCEGMATALPGIPMVVESAAMYQWDKFAPEIYTPEGWLVPAAA